MICCPVCFVCDTEEIKTYASGRRVCLRKRDDEDEKFFNRCSSYCTTIQALLGILGYKCVPSGLVNVLVYLMALAIQAFQHANFDEVCVLWRSL
jgi:hypothetical protein